MIDVKTYIGINLGGMFIKCSIVNETREIIEGDKDATPAKSYKTSVIEQI